MVTIYANIDGNNDSRVTYEDTGSKLKVDWNETGESFVVVRGNMSATSDDEKKFTFSHKTAIIKPTFNINDNAVSNSSITKIILKGIVNVKDMMDEDDITVTIPEEGNIDNIYIYLHPKELNSTEIYKAGDVIDMEVYIKENEEEKNIPER